MKKSQLQQIIREEIQNEIVSYNTVKSGRYEIISKDGKYYRLYLDGIAVGPYFSEGSMYGFNMDTQLLNPLRQIAGLSKTNTPTFDPSMNQ